MWDIWSKQSDEKYNKETNYIIWDTLKDNINFNYYILKHNKENDKELKNLFKTIKPYIPIINDISNIKKVVMNNKYLNDKEYEGEQLNFKHFKENKTLILESGTGTGKTSTTAKIIRR